MGFWRYKKNLLTPYILHVSCKCKDIFLYRIFFIHLSTLSP